ncbi:hypothetical protein [Burkholderia sp. MSMB1835]|uniref:hypothetical protein n=1 Tax=Burkholderia sp. MSMB1835 TaxID=1637876 RepID=UPI0012E3387B|nr:hypothetical protein [Burkholderia sp. MSMB1835]
MHDLNEVRLSWCAIADGRFPENAARRAWDEISDEATSAKLLPDDNPFMFVVWKIALFGAIFSMCSARAA